MVRLKRAPRASTPSRTNQPNMPVRLSARTDRRSWRAATLCTALVIAVASLVTARASDARETPDWLRRLLHVAPRREALLAASDTVVVFGPKIMALGSATSGTFVERFTVATPQSGAYLLRVTNGPAGAPGITGGTVSLNGTVVLGAADLSAMAAGTSRDIPVLVTATDTLVAVLSGPVNAAISVALLTLPDPTFIVFGPRQYERAKGAPVTITESFTLPAGAASPAYLCIRNGEPDGSRRNSSSRVSLNGVVIVSHSDASRHFGIAILSRPPSSVTHRVSRARSSGHSGSD